MGVLPLRVGFGMAAAAHLWYLAQVPGLVVPLVVYVVQIVGLATAALDPQRGRTLLLGLAITAGAAVVDVVYSFTGGFTLWSIPPVVYATGLLMGASVAGRRGHAFGVKAGAATAALGASLWILLDPFNAVGPWLPGNLLSLVGWGIVAALFHDAPREPAPAAEAPS